MFSDKKDGFALAAQYIVQKMDDIYENNRETFDNKIVDVGKARVMLKMWELTSKDDFQNPKLKFCLIARFAALALSAPVAAFGFLNAIFPMLINYKICSLFKDKQFVPSARYVVGLFFVPLFTIIQSVILGLFTNWTLALGYFIAVPIAFYFGLWWRRWFFKTEKDWKVQHFAKSDDWMWNEVVRYARFN